MQRFIWIHFPVQQSVSINTQTLTHIPAASKQGSTAVASLAIYQLCHLAASVNNVSFHAGVIFKA